LNASHIIDDEASVTAVVQAAMAGTASPRLRQVMAAVVEHAHALIREVDLTEEEFETAVRFITLLGQQTNACHNEVILAADVLGISTLVALRNHAEQDGETAAALLGPFWRADAPFCANGAAIARCDMPGAVMDVAGTVFDNEGRPLAGAVVDVWQASPVGLYENQDPQQPEMNLRGRFRTDAQGRYWFRTVRPAGYPVPTHGIVGDLLRAQGRHCMRPAHVHFMVCREGYETLITQVFADDSEHLESDVVFGVRRSLVGRFHPHQPAPGSDEPHFRLHYDFVLRPGTSCLPVPPIK
jgi:catechol 1,2-dioxygenase